MKPFVPLKPWLHNLVNLNTAIGLTSLAGTRYLKMIIQNNQSSFIKLTSQIDYADTAKILASTKKGGHELFYQFKCFETEVYYGIIVSIVLISGLISVYKKSVKTFLEVFWTYFSVIINGSSDSLKFQHNFDRLIFSVWLLVCTLIMSAFSGQLRDQLIKPRPIEWIDSWQDLHEWKDVTIQTLVLTELATFINKSADNPMAQDFRQRTELLSDAIIKQSMDEVLDFKGVSEGKVALVFPTKYLLVLRRNLMKRGLQKDIDFHLSQFGDQTIPCFVTYNTKNLKPIHERILLKL